MQSAMQLFVARFASRNPCISQMFVFPKKPRAHQRVRLHSTSLPNAGVKAQPQLLNCALSVRQKKLASHRPTPCATTSRDQRLHAPA